MTDFNLGKLISKYVNYNVMASAKSTVIQRGDFQAQQVPQPVTQSVSPSAQSATPPVEVKMGQLTGADNSIFIKDVMKLPKNMNELVYMLQRNISLAQLNQKFAGTMNGRLSSSQAQILAQLEGLNTGEIQMAINKVSAGSLSQLQSTLKNLEINGSILIDLNEISSMIKANGKDAIAKLISAMANASKGGITDLSQMKDAARLINASVAAAAQNDNAQTMKLLMLLYLPWLPLQEGVGFDLSIETAKNAKDSDSILTITITTINYGIVTATLILESSNSVLVNINCSENFPKDELILRIESDEKHYSMQSSLTFETSQKQIASQEQQKAKINMSDTNKINPYLLLMAHTIIRHTLELDKSA